VITKLNLASHPFRNRTPPYVLALVMLACAVAGALLCFSSLREAIAQNEIVKQQIEQMDAESKRLKGEGEKVQQQLSPEQRALLIGAHKLVANKTFGWSRLFADLEQVLPGSVSASRISVANIYRENDRVKAELEFSVLSRDYQSVMTMIENMNSSGMFQAELRGQDLQKNERFTYTEYTLRLIYTPGYGYSTAPQTDVAQTDQGGNQR
jgi:Tfp pilus assembly protein PilN